MRTRPRDSEPRRSESGSILFPVDSDREGGAGRHAHPALDLTSLPQSAEQVYEAIDVMNADTSRRT